MTLAVLLAGLAAVPGLPSPAAAFDEQAVMECAFIRALSMATCKPPEEFQFMGVRDGTYVYNVHFGSHFTEFYIQVNENLAIITSKSWHGRMASAEIIRDYTNGCIDLDMKPAPCSPLKNARCCGK
ncbi:hypothetical protein G3N56_06625 [Desulfovibrio sulfodismutans]|uniref:Uncharacterized protein n=1 Tax=Desulfolutivibrio sulfodismutans TaxID=63561 RepID=A0A7K3NJM2_9BACT|nr:hypothetical protein [Desulfolutivibrio sulfodismutans]QLA14565.1 hypothetical protein GD606_16920 [Desulfolutivibrio sulfodismutans DSM 3696]